MREKNCGNSEQKQALKIGTKVQLIRLNDPYSTLKPGEIGTVQSIDSYGHIKVLWEHGSTLALIRGIDLYKIYNVDD